MTLAPLPLPPETTPGPKGNRLGTLQTTQSHFQHPITPPAPFSHHPHISWGIFFDLPHFVWYNFFYVATS